jgi:hypothetical protein
MDTGEVIYRGPGDSHIPGHPGSVAGMQMFVWCKRRAAHNLSGSRGRVMVDLGRVVLRMHRGSSMVGDGHGVAQHNPYSVMRPENNDKDVNEPYPERPMSPGEKTGFGV